MSFVNEFQRFDIESLNEKFEFVFKFCDENENEENNFVKESCELIHQTVQDVNNVAYEYVFENLSLNGFVVYLKVIDCFMTKLIKILNKKESKKHLSSFIKMVLNFNKNINIIRRLQKIEEDSGENKKSLNQLFLSERDFYDQINYDDKKNDEIILSKFHFFWINDKSKNHLDFISSYIAYQQNLPFSFSCLWNKNQKGKYLKKYFMNSSLYNPFDFMDKSNDLSFKIFIKTITKLDCKIKFKSLKVERQKRFKISYKGKIFDFEKMSENELEEFKNDDVQRERENCEKIRFKNYENVDCLLVKLKKKKVKKSLENIKKDKLANNMKSIRVHSATKNPQKNCTNNLSDQSNLETEFENNVSEENSFIENKPAEDTILVNIHGGGFCIKTPDEMVLKKTVSSLAGIPIFSINYSLTVPFPVSCQDILDAYLWLVSGKKEVADIIGFNPKKIIITGDSAGGFLCLQLIYVINDLNRLLVSQDNKEEKILQVSTFVGLYPVFSFSSSPSKTFLKYDSILSLYLNLIIASKYLGNISTDNDYKKIENSELFQKIVKKNENVLKEEISELKTDSKENKKEKDKAWYFCDYDTYKNRVDYLETFLSNPYVLFFDYKHFDDLKDITINFIVGEYDFYLDDCIDFPKLWKGKITVDVLEDLVHGFQYFTMISDKCNQANNFYIKRLQQACGLC